ncbi:MAG: hypothetical protein IPO07_17470 [Haliscomenobacter sp.]|nr:hypothetical protein [Haliscomenobacter sp.]MBK9490363.1 hypothetical protein [Haliscomenobacter sp.]
MDKCSGAAWNMGWVKKNLVSADVDKGQKLNSTLMAKVDVFQVKSLSAKSQVRFFADFYAHVAHKTKMHYICRANAKGVRPFF